MTQQRQFRRIPLVAKVSLTHGESTHRGKIENASLNGALVSFSESLAVHAGARCDLLIDVESEDTPLRLEAKVVQKCFTMVGLQFVSVAPDTRLHLYQVLRRAAENPSGLASELEALITGTE